MMDLWITAAAAASVYYVPSTGVDNNKSCSQPCNAGVLVENSS